MSVYPEYSMEKLGERMKEAGLSFSRFYKVYNINKKRLRKIINNETRAMTSTIMKFNMLFKCSLRDMVDTGEDYDGFPVMEWRDGTQLSYWPIKKYAKDRGISLFKMIKNITDKDVASDISKDRNIEFNTVIKICKELHLPPDYVVGLK